MEEAQSRRVQQWRTRAGDVCKEEEEVAAAKSECELKEKRKRVSPLNITAPERSWAAAWRAKGNRQPTRAQKIGKLLRRPHVCWSACGQIHCRSVTRVGHNGVQLTRQINARCDELAKIIIFISNML
jgi:hypothetical protein